MKFGAQFLGGWSGWGRGMLATIFVVAGALKVANSADFHSDLVAYQTGLPDSILRLIAVVLPWIDRVAEHPINLEGYNTAPSTLRH